MAYQLYINCLPGNWMIRTMFISDDWDVLHSSVNLWYCEGQC